MTIIVKTNANPLQNLHDSTVNQGVTLPPVYDFLTEGSNDLAAFMDRMAEAQRLASVLAKMAFHLGLVQLLKDHAVVASITLGYSNTSSTGIGLGNLKKGVQLVFIDAAADAPAHQRAAQKTLDKLRMALPFNSVDAVAVSALFRGVPGGQDFTITRENGQVYLEHVMGPEVYTRHKVSVERRALRAVIADAGRAPSVPAASDRPRL